MVLSINYRSSGQALCTAPTSSTILTTQTVTGSVTWADSYYIPSGEVVTIDAATISLANNSIIEVGIGGKLIIQNGSTLSSGCTTNRWNGIIVDGNNTQTQSVQSGGGYLQGYLSIDQSNIDRANRGVISYQGGIVVASNSTFTNNPIGVRIEDYNISLHNSCHFNFCTFSWDFVDPNNPIIHLDLDKVYGIEIHSSTFINNAPSSNPHYRGYGIKCKDASFWTSATNYITDPNTNCPIAQDKTIFQYLDHAIYTEGTIPANTNTNSYVTYTKFIDNHYGIWTVTDQNFYINNSQFTYNMGTDRSSDPAYLKTFDFIDMIGSATASNYVIISKCSFTFELPDNDINLMTFEHYKGDIDINMCTIRNNVGYNPLAPGIVGSVAHRFATCSGNVKIRCNKYYAMHRDWDIQGGQPTSMGSTSLDFSNLFTDVGTQYNSYNIHSLSPFTYYTHQTNNYQPRPNQTTFPVYSNCIKNSTMPTSLDECVDYCPPGNPLYKKADGKKQGNGFDNQLADISNIEIYPNPVNSGTIITLKSNIEMQIKTICISNMLGQMVYRENRTALSEKQIQLPQLPPGNYMIVIESENNLRTIKQLVIK